MTYRNDKKVLGISAFYHDSAAALLIDGKIVFAAQEERFSRQKHDPSFPGKSVQQCLTWSGITPSELDRVVFYESPLLKFSRVAGMFARNIPDVFSKKGQTSLMAAANSWLGSERKLFFKQHLIRRSEDYLRGFDWSRFSVVRHHDSHAASAFYASPYERALVVVIDGVGEWACTSAYLSDGNQIRKIKEIAYPHSLGLLYSAFTRYLGFRVNSGEYKVMGLAPYGTPRYADLIFDRLVDLLPDGEYKLNQEYFDFWSGGIPVTDLFCELFGGNPKPLDTTPTQREMDLAASIQQVIEICIEHFVRGMQALTDSKNLCMAGGVALNCVANGRLARTGLFNGIWVQPAAGDAGGALGAVLWHHWNRVATQTRIVNSNQRDEMQGAYLGTQYTNIQIKTSLDEAGAKYRKIDSPAVINKQVAKLLAEGNIVGRFDGRMEFGPRALGNRSILADPRSPEMQKRLNLKIKFRESFRPFAPSVLSEYVDEWFEGNAGSSYMTFVDILKKEHRLSFKSSAYDSEDPFSTINSMRSSVPAITHLDFSARLQVVNAEENPSYHALIHEFFEATGVPMIVNTSFNVRGEPIVESPNDALRCFFNTNMDALVIGSYLLIKHEQCLDIADKYESAIGID